MKNLAIKVGKEIRKARKAKGFSQERLALNAKIDRSYMGRIERGEANTP
ncbi:helix-turn-helix domain-containing protein [Pseudoalteromonas sp. SR41-6]